ncbi:MAG: hypothetical protein FVQ82_05985 [Planctomycetes bacterium]|nr:hypothetical protein [Planctomycetota bacterium]
MFYAGYTEYGFQKTLENISDSGIDLERPYFALLLFREIDDNLISYLTENWEKLNHSTGECIHLLGPIRPTGGKFSADSPLFPTVEREPEGNEFKNKLSKAGVDLATLPMVIFFKIISNEEHDISVAIIKSLPLGKYESNEQSIKSYGDLFSTIINVANSSFYTNASDIDFVNELKRKILFDSIKDALTVEIAIKVLKVLYKIFKPG